jgi:hypothetical protein
MVEGNKGSPEKGFGEPGCGNAANDRDKKIAKDPVFDPHHLNIVPGEPHDSQRIIFSPLICSHFVLQGRDREKRPCRTGVKTAMKKKRNVYCSDEERREHERQGSEELDEHVE